MGNLKPLIEEIASLDPLSARGVIFDRLVEPSSHQLSVLCAGYKAEKARYSWEEIFKAFGYEPQDLKSITSAIYDYHRIMRGDLGRRIFLGWEELDKTMRGIRPGQVCGLMARAGVGKTTFAVNLLVNCFNSGDPHPILFFSLEMPAAEIAARLFSVDQETYPSKVEKYFTLSAESPTVAEWSLKYSDLVIVDRGSLTIEDMSGLYDRSCKYLGGHIPLMIVDYQGLVRSRGSSVYERSSDVAIGLKAFAKEKGTAVFTLIQTSRRGGVGKERITMDMARDSGQIEEAVDFLLSAWRPNMGAEDEMYEDEFWLTISKNRHGRTRDIEMVFDSRFLKIREP